MPNPKKGPIGDVHIPDRKEEEIEDPGHNEPVRRDPGQPKKEKLPPDPDQPDAPVEEP